MNAAWVACLPADRASACVALRLEEGLLAAFVGNIFWLKGETLTESLSTRLRSIPGLQRYNVRDSGGLIPVGGTIPTGRIPDTHWVPLVETFVPKPLEARYPSTRPQATDVTLVRSGCERESTALLAKFDVFVEWTCLAPIQALRPLSFAKLNLETVLVRGVPVPSIPGVSCWSSEDVIVPAGFMFDPPVGMKLIRAALMRECDDQGGSSFVFNHDGSWQKLAERDFLPVSRGSVRANTNEPRQ